ncbi:hypothetical protein ACJX0J_031194 [Zea mays]
MQRGKGKRFKKLCKIEVILKVWQAELQSLSPAYHLDEIWIHENTDHAANKQRNINNSFQTTLEEMGFGMSEAGDTGIFASMEKGTCGIERQAYFGIAEIFQTWLNFDTFHMQSMNLIWIL